MRLIRSPPLKIQTYLCLYVHRNRCPKDEEFLTILLVSPSDTSHDARLVRDGDETNVGAANIQYIWTTTTLPPIPECMKVGFQRENGLLIPLEIEQGQSERQLPHRPG